MNKYGGLLSFAFFKKMLNLGLLFSCLGLLLGACGDPGSGIESNPALVPTSTVKQVATTTPGQPVIPVLTVKPTTGLAEANNKDWQYRWLRGIPCQPPCWEGITPGKTTPAEALELVKSNPLVGEWDNSKPQWEDRNRYISWNWVGQTRPVPYSIPDWGGDMWYPSKGENQTITFIRPHYYVNYKLGEVIKAYGQPDQIVAEANEYENNLKYYSVIMVYVNKGIWLDAAKTVKFNIDGNLSIDSIEFFPAGLNGLNQAFGGQGWRDWLINWEGFQTFDFYCHHGAFIDKEDCPNSVKVP